MIDDTEVRLEGFETWNVLLQHGESDWNRFADETKAKETTACLLSTSGTTGLPKLAIITHAACVAQGTILSDATEKPYVVKRLIFLPMFHAFTWPLGLTLPLREGCPTYVMPKFDMQRFGDSVRTFGITETALVPPLCAALLASVDIDEALKELRLIWCAGAPLPALSLHQLYGRLVPDARMAQVWGLTECGWVTTFLFPEKDYSASVGRLLPNTEAKSVRQECKGT